MITKSYIPPNMNDNGGFLNGYFDTRKFTEAAILVFICYVIVLQGLFFIPYLIRTGMFISISLFLILFAMLGIDGMPLSVGLTTLISYHKTKCEVSLRKPMPINTSVKKKNTLKIKINK